MLGRRLIIAFLFAAWLLTPDLLCLIPGVQMTVEQHECCETMGPDCGRVPMPDMHSCCQTTTSADAVLVRTADYPEHRLMTLAAAISGFDWSLGANLSTRWLHFESPTPPPLIPRGSFEVLRI
jgi:hypothetical protein